MKSLLLPALLTLTPRPALAQCYRSGSYVPPVAPPKAIAPCTHSPGTGPCNSNSPPQALVRARAQRK